MTEEVEPVSKPIWGIAGVPQPWSVGDAIGHGWTSLWKNLIRLCVAYFAYLVIGIGIGTSVGFLAQSFLRVRLAAFSSPMAPPIPRAVVIVWASVAAALLTLLLATPIQIGLLRGWIAAARGERVVLRKSLVGFRGAFRILILDFLLMVFAFVPTGILFWGFALAPHFVVDQNMSAGAALRASWRATRGYKGNLWLLGLCIAPIQILGLTAGGIGLCATSSLVGIALAYIYVRVTGRTVLPPYSPEFASRSMRIMLRTTLAVFSAGFLGCILLVHSLPPVRGSAWTPLDAAVRVLTILLGIATTLLLLSTLLPWILDRLEGARFSLFVGARHVRSQKSGFLTVISVLSICGVAISSCALSSVISVMGGFSNDLKHKILGNNAHIVIDTDSQQPYGDYGPVLDRVRAMPGIVSATPVVSGEVMMSSPSNLAGVIVRGVDPATIGEVIDLKSNIEVGTFHYLEDPEALRHLGADEVIGIGPRGEEYKKGSDLLLFNDEMDPAVSAAIDRSPPWRPGIIIGRELSHTLHVYVGDEVQLVSPLGDLGPMGVMPRTKKFRVAAIFYSAMYEYDATHVYTLIDVAQEYFATGGKITAIDVKVKDAERADLMTPVVTAGIARSDLRVRDWRDMNKNLFSALKLERLATFIILSIAIMVASFCIICTLLLMVTEKGKEIAILKALGASDGDILRTFMTEGIVIGGIGTAFGVATGLAQCAGLAWFGLRLPSDVYYIDRLPVHVSGWDFGAVALAAMFICTLATIYPAYAASRLRPVDGLRYE